jgi:hypothetical protein
MSESHQVKTATNLTIKGTVQVVPSREYDYTKVQTCLVIRTRLIYQCGAHSHTSIAHGGLIADEVLSDISILKCQTMLDESLLLQIQEY